jgi:hypothetical protein
MDSPVKRKRIRRMVLAFIILALAAGVYVFYTELRPVVIFGLRDDFARAVPYQEVPAGIPGIRAEDCGVCHREIYEEWKTSIHAQAYVDPFFQAYWKKDKHIWICLNCHTPLENQQPELIGDIPRNRVEKAVRRPNPRFDPEFQKEGITCAGCHVRDGVILGPYEDSVAPHPTKYDPLFQSAEFCFRCHQVPSGPFQFYRFGPCGTYPEFEGGHYYEQGYICQTCHMPEVERPAADGGPVRKVRRHLWRGGHDPEQIRRAVTIGVRAEPPRLDPGAKATFTLTLSNSGAGHNLPTGDPDRYFTIEFEVLGEENKVVSGKTYTMGRWILWQPVILEVYDNRLAPLESRDYTFRYAIPGGRSKTPPVLRTRVRYHIMTEKAHRMLEEKYGLTAEDPYVFTIFEKTFKLSGEFSRVMETAAVGRSMNERHLSQRFCGTGPAASGKSRSSSTATSLGSVSEWIAETETAS